MVETAIPRTEVSVVKVECCQAEEPQAAPLVSLDVDVVVVVVVELEHRRHHCRSPTVAALRPTSPEVVSVVQCHVCRSAVVPVVAVVPLWLVELVEVKVVRVEVSVVKWLPVTMLVM